MLPINIGVRYCELDKKVANEMEAMEQNAVLPKRWNGPLEQEHLNSQHPAWGHAKQKDHEDKIAHYDEAESLNLDKLLQAQIKTLQDNPEIDWKEKIKALQQQVEDKRKTWQGYKNRQQAINKYIQELKNNGLSGTHMNGHQPTHPVDNRVVGKDI
ncbi:hypothetical protein BYT27DRAFT_7260409 [Phlegmacium glaucopus]|nr:hypothetical protein BYT27DRAFT_7260409 [Phlegmacium glaucopus]